MPGGEGEPKYAPDVTELVAPERNTLTISFKDIESYNRNLATTIQDEYYRFAFDIVCTFWLVSFAELMLFLHIFSFTECEQFWAMLLFIKRHRVLYLIRRMRDLCLKPSAHAQVNWTAIVIETVV